jgi:hypothetical protein
VARRETLEKFWEFDFACDIVTTLGFKERMVGEVLSRKLMTPLYSLVWRPLRWRTSRPLYIYCNFVRISLISIVFSTFLIKLCSPPRLRVDPP